QAHAPQVKSRNISEPEERAEKTTDDCTHDPQQDGGDDSSRLFPGYEEFRQNTRDEAEHDPRDYTHKSPLSMAQYNGVTGPLEIGRRSGNERLRRTFSGYLVFAGSCTIIPLKRSRSFQSLP